MLVFMWSVISVLLKTRTRAHTHTHTHTHTPLFMCKTFSMINSPVICHLLRGVPLRSGLHLLCESVIVQWIITIIMKSCNENITTKACIIIKQQKKVKLRTFYWFSQYKLLSKSSKDFLYGRIQSNWLFLFSCTD